MKITLTAIVLCSICLMSCQPAKNKGEETVNPDETAMETVEEIAPDTIAPAIVDPGITPGTVLSDTIGVYKLSDPEGRAYIVEMNKLLVGMETAIDDNAPERFLKLMGSLRENQQGRQVQIQSKLSDSDRALFKVYMNKVADKLLALSDKLEKM